MGGQGEDHTGPMCARGGLSLGAAAALLHASQEQQPKSGHSSRAGFGYASFHLVVEGKAATYASGLFDKVSVFRQGSGRYEGPREFGPADVVLEQGG